MSLNFEQYAIFSNKSSPTFLLLQVFEFSMSSGFPRLVPALSLVFPFVVFRSLAQVGYWAGKKPGINLVLRVTTSHGKKFYILVHEKWAQLCSITDCPLIIPSVPTTLPTTIRNVVPTSLCQSLELARALLTTDSANLLVFRRNKSFTT